AGCCWPLSWWRSPCSRGVGAAGGPARGRKGLVAVTLELLYFDGCPNHEALLPHLERLVRGAEIRSEMRLRRIADDNAAQHERFLGSPTVRVDGRDVEP